MKTLSRGYQNIKELGAIGGFSLGLTLLIPGMFFAHYELSYWLGLPIGIILCLVLIITASHRRK